MARGLSELQRAILALALAIKRRRGQEGLYDLDAPTVLVAVYGFPVTRDGIYSFERAKIGQGRYQAATAAVSKALRRLVERGLMERPRYGHGTLARGLVRLTPEGERLAETLPPVPLPSVRWLPEPGAGEQHGP